MDKSSHLQYPLIKQILKSLGKFILFLLLALVFLALGIIVGYSVIGGGNFWEALNQDTWKHIWNFIR